MNKAQTPDLSVAARTRNIVELNIAVVLFGGTALFAKLLPVPVVSVIFGRAVVAALALLVFAIATGTLRTGSRRETIVLLISGVLMAVHWVTYFHAVRVSTVAVGTISLHTYPVMTVLLEPLVNRRKIRPPDALLALVVLAGVVVLVPDFSLANVRSQGVLWGVVSAAIFTVRNLIVRRSVQRIPGSTVMLFQTAVTALVLAPFVAVDGGFAGIGANWAGFLLLGTVFTALPQSLYASSLRGLSAKTVAIIATLLPLYATIFAILFLDEVPDVRTIIGGVIVVGAVMIETVRVSGGRA